jgi:hypothetical protein
MNRSDTTALASEFMQDFAMQTGLDPLKPHPRRYLWTDAFAVCNYLGLFRQTHNEHYRDLALRLVDQVHHTLGRYRDDDNRTGWISGLSAGEGELHPTLGGLRIGKTLPERGMNEPYNEQREWDQDGQYYHYLTKWMHALNQVSRITGNPVYLSWAIELAKTANAKFTYPSSASGRMKMYWKMSTDLTRPLVPSMGQHDPLDGFVTCCELRETATRIFEEPDKNVLEREMADLAGICRGIQLVTDDPLGIGGLLFDASRISQSALHGGKPYAGLLDALLRSALTGLTSFTGSGSLELPARYRLAFRELGVSIGLAGVATLQGIIRNNSELSGKKSVLQQKVDALLEYAPFRENIQQFWLDDNNRKTTSWTEHREINTVMLATSLAPEGFLEP